MCSHLHFIRCFHTYILSDVSTLTFDQMFPHWHFIRCFHTDILSDVSPLTLNTEDISLHLHEETKLVLNCTYQKESNEEIRDRDIRWQKWIGNTFEDVGVFSPPGGREPIIAGEMGSLYNNRTEFIAPTDGSLSAVLILKDLICSDVGEYRCWVGYYFNGDSELTSLSTVAFKGKTILCIWECWKIVVLPPRSGRGAYCFCPACLSFCILFFLKL